MKSVLVVGGGPAGLAAAKTLLHGATKTKVKVTVYEAAQRVGGMWRAQPGEDGDKCSPDMRVNLSRFTVAFSDLSWQDVKLDDGKRRFSMFPKAHEVGRYLETYARKYIPDGVIQLNTQVKSADLVQEQHRKWRVVSVDTELNEEKTDTFDYLVVASGFFDRPYIGNFSINLDNSSRVQHSSQFRNISTLTDKSGNIVVIGGSISGSEAAATAALQLSNARHSITSPNNPPAWKDSKIYHIFRRPFYCLPRYLPSNPYDPAIQDFNLAPQFLPVDLALYDLGRRGNGPINASNGLMPPEKAKKGHEYLRSLVGGDQRDICQFHLAHKPDQTQYPTYVGIADTYAEFVRSGLIVPVRGQVTGLEEKAGAHGSLEVSFQQEEPWVLPTETMTKIEDVAGVIQATGFQVHLDYLSSAVKDTLDYSPDTPRLPFLLSHGSVFHPDVPEMGFVGFYEGPYWGVLEMQSRLIAQKLVGEDLPDHFGQVEQIQKDLRDAMRKRENNIPQFWMGDYVGLVDEIARNLNIERTDQPFDGQKGPTLPSRYCGAGTDTDEAAKVVQEVRVLLHDAQSKSRFVPAAAFRAMQGGWKLERKIDSRNKSSPGGTLKGTAHFHPRFPTDPKYTAEYLYIEEGTFTMDTGLSFPATRRYVYRYDETNDDISAWFVEGDQVTVERLFNRLHFEPPNDKSKGWLAKGSHWCDPDQYESSCEFRFRGASLPMFGITHTSRGPNKDYTMESWYTKPTGP